MKYLIPIVLLAIIAGVTVRRGGIIIPAVCLILIGVVIVDPDGVVGNTLTLVGNGIGTAFSSVAASLGKAA